MRQYFNLQAYKSIKKATYKNRNKTIDKQYGLFAPTIPQCTIHKQLMIKHPKGNSKRTGRPYNAFWGCPIRDKLGFCSQSFLITPNNDLPKTNNLSHWK